MKLFSKATLLIAGAATLAATSPAMADYGYGRGNGYNYGGRGYEGRGYEGRGYEHHDDDNR